MLSVKFSSRSATSDDLKENRLSATIAGVTLCYMPELGWLENLATFVKPPPGVFEGVVPAERSKIRLSLDDVSLHLASSAQRSRAVVLVPALTFATDLVPDMPTSQSRIELTDVRLLLTDDELSAPAASTRALIIEHWASRGFVEVALLRTCAVAVRRGNGSVLPDLDVRARVSRLRLTVQVTLIEPELIASFCPDSLITLSALAGGLGPQATVSPPTEPAAYGSLA